MSNTAQTISQLTWNLKYQLKNPDGNIIDFSVEETFRRVAKTLAKAEKPSEQSMWEQSFYDAMTNFKFLPAGRILAGAGTERNVTLFNCFVMGKIHDSMEGIFSGVKESALTQQQGGGIGVDFSTLRPFGSLVKGVGSTASGPLSFMGVWDQMCRTILSAGSRRGAMMATMRCDHPDIERFIEAKKNPDKLRMFNLSVLVTDAFMDAVKNDNPWDLVFEGKTYNTISAKNLWDTIIKNTYEVAEPGVIFIDRINKKNNLKYCENIQSTNPCFTGSTKVWTINGPIPFKKLAKSGKSVNVLTQLDNGKIAWRKMIKPRITQKNAKIIEITIRGSGRKNKSITKFSCTPEHIIYLKDGSSKQASELKFGDRISSIYRWRCNQSMYRYSNGIEAPLEHHLVAELVHGRRPDYPEEHVHHKDGNRDNNNPDNIEIKNGSLHNSEHILGDLNPMRRFPEKNYFANNDFSGKKNGRWRNDIDDKTLEDLRKTGLSYKSIADNLGCSKYTVMKRLGWERPNNADNHVVKKVKFLNKKKNVYCGTVPSTGKFFISTSKNEGVLVSNCGEQPLPPYGACLLGSINLAALVEQPFLSNSGINPFKLEELVRTVIRMLDNVIDVSNYPLPEQEMEAKKKRRIGLGVTGLADALVMCGKKYNSNEGRELASTWIEMIKRFSYNTSINLAKEKEPFELFDPAKFGSELINNLPDILQDNLITNGIRNSHLTSIAPTGTISLFAGNVSSGIEPIFNPEYERKILEPDGSHRVETVTDYAVTKWRELGNSGFPPCMVVVDDLKPIDHLMMQATLQEHIDTSISKTINCPEDIPFEDFKDVYETAYDLDLKGCTTYRPNDITGSILSKKEVKKDTKPVPREPKLNGSTYKVKPNGDHALYITINDLEEDGKLRPFEIFFASKAMEHFQWSAALSRMISAVFRRGNDVAFVAEELQAIFDPRGGYWDKGKYVPSAVAAIGQIIEQHMKEIGFLEVEEQPKIEQIKGVYEKTKEPYIKTKYSQCPKCSQITLIHQEGCDKCLSGCGYSKCG